MTIIDIRRFMFEIVSHVNMKNTLIIVKCIVE